MSSEAASYLSITPSFVAPELALVDDFVATHHIQTNSIHFVVRAVRRAAHSRQELTLPTISGPKFPWHRYHFAAFEAAFRNECGYSGAQP